LWYSIRYCRDITGSKASATVLVVKPFCGPWLFVSQDGVEDGEEFAGCRDGDEHFGLSGVDEALAKGLEDGVVTAGGEACEKEGGADGLAAAGDHGFALPLAGWIDG
jgi:hypothetical protein